MAHTRLDVTAIVSVVAPLTLRSAYPAPIRSAGRCG